MPTMKTQRQKNQKLVEIKRTVSHTIDGTGIQKSFYGKTKSEAVARYNEYMADQKEGRLVLKDCTFAKWSRIWLETYKRGKVKDNSYQYTYVNAVEKHLIPYFGKSALCDIKAVDIQKFFNVKAETHSKESIKKMRMCLDGIFRTAMENDLCVKNPVTQDLRIPEDCGDDTMVKQTYTKEQRDAVIEYAKTHRFGLDIIVLLKTGIRRGELLGLKWEDVNEAKGVLYIRRAVADVRDEKTREWTVQVDKPKTPQSIRVIPIDDELLAMFRARPLTITVGKNVHKGQPGVEVRPEFIFHDAKGKVSSPNNWTHRRYKVFMKEMHEYYASLDDPVDIPMLNPHELRHTAATIWKDDGVDLFSIAKLGGWADLDMLSKRYAHNNVDTLKRALGFNKCKKREPDE